MAFKDLTKILHEGKIKLDYKDKPHRYYARPRIDWSLPETDLKAWGKIMYPKGVTTMIEDTIEKKGLLTWPMGLSLRELFGFYNFKNNDGEQMLGFSKTQQGELIGTLWADGKTLSVNPNTLLPIVKSASEAYIRKKKKGADIGTVVHAAILRFLEGQPFDIGEQYMWLIKESLYETEAERAKALEDFSEDVAAATLAFKQIENWLLKTNPELYAAEDLLYSMDHNLGGTFDADFGIKPDFHPMAHLFKGKKLIRCTTDFKTSNASTSKQAVMPEGISYDYFLQESVYELMRREMGLPPNDDLLTASARKDGGSSLIFASELGLSMEGCLHWAEAVILCFRMREKTRAGLMAHAESKEGST